MLPRFQRPLVSESSRDTLFLYQDEIFVEGLGPSIEQLVALEDVDILKYMSWEERPPAIELEKCKMVRIKHRFIRYNLFDVRY